MQKIREKWQPYMLRPLIYMTFTRFLLALTAALLIDFFFSAGAGRSLKETAFLLVGFLFALLAVIAWLRLDGIQLPKLMMLRINPRKKPSRMYGDMIDYIDEQPQIAFEDLDDGEKDICILGADAFCCAAFLIASLFV
ncbi:MAG: hypothetical protein IJ240_05825 [Clostridia bacterium]|nr:hypothetical protein [Clostridia bacterium]